MILLVEADRLVAVLEDPKNRSCRWVVLLCESGRRTQHGKHHH